MDLLARFGPDALVSKEGIEIDFVEAVEAVSAFVTGGSDIAAEGAGSNTGDDVDDIDGGFIVEGIGEGFFVEFSGCGVLRVDGVDDSGLSGDLDVEEEALFTFDAGPDCVPDVGGVEGIDDDGAYVVSEVFEIDLGFLHGLVGDEFVSDGTASAVSVVGTERSDGEVFMRDFERIVDFEFFESEFMEVDGNLESEGSGAGELDIEAVEGCGYEDVSLA